MGRSVAIALFINILCFSVAAFGVDRQPSQPELDRIEEIRRMIEREGYAWEAGVTSVSHLSPEEFQQLLGLRVPVDFEARRAMALKEGRIIKAITGMAFPSLWMLRSRRPLFSGRFNSGPTW